MKQLNIKEWKFYETNNWRETDVFSYENNLGSGIPTNFKGSMGFESLFVRSMIYRLTKPNGIYDVLDFEVNGAYKWYKIADLIADVSALNKQLIFG